MWEYVWMCGRRVDVWEEGGCVGGGCECSLGDARIRPSSWYILLPQK